MDFVQNFPFISILLSLFSGPLTSILNGKWAKRVNTLVITVIGFLSGAVLFYVLENQWYIRWPLGALLGAFELYRIIKRKSVF